MKGCSHLVGGMTYSNPLRVFWHCWLLCLIGVGCTVASYLPDLVPLAISCLLFRTAERSDWCGVICCERHCKTCLYLWTGLSPITLVVDGIRPMAFESRVDYLQLPFRIGVRQWPFYVLTSESKYLLQSSLGFYPKDIAPASRMMNHPMKKTIVGIIRSSPFIWASSLLQLKLVKQVEDCHHMLILEEVLSLIFCCFVRVTLLWSSSSI